ncbi:hypothetical protein Bbelb_049840 [Branchiostoma belcheri]|nr:hypothetical protein Bbelb_049840 [Branchiostoma belcheri]
MAVSIILGYHRMICLEIQLQGLVKTADMAEGLRTRTDETMRISTQRWEGATLLGMGRHRPGQAYDQRLAQLARESPCLPRSTVGKKRKRGGNRGRGRRSCGARADGPGRGHIATKFPSWRTRRGKFPLGGLDSTRVSALVGLHRLRAGTPLRELPSVGHHAISTVRVERELPSCATWQGTPLVTDFVHKDNARELPSCVTWQGTPLVTDFVHEHHARELPSCVTWQGTPLVTDFVHEHRSSRPGRGKFPLGRLRQKLSVAASTTAAVPRVRVTRPNGTLLALAEERGRQREAVTLHVHEVTEEGRQHPAFEQLHSDRSLSVVCPRGWECQIPSAGKIDPGQLSDEIFAETKEFITRGQLDQHEKGKDRQKTKFDRLQQKKTISAADSDPNWRSNSSEPKTTTQAKTDERWVKNLSSHTLTEPEKSLLSKGLNFAVAPNKIPSIDIVTETESAIRRARLPQRQAEALRTKVATTLKVSKPPASNITREEGTALKDLATDQDILILPADKGRCTVVLDREQYDRKVQDLLGDKDTYMPLKKDPTNKFKGKISSALKKLQTEGVLDRPSYLKLNPTTEQPPAFYGLPKIHKVSLYDP